MVMAKLRHADPDTPASDYIKGVPGTVGELLDALDTHGLDAIESAEGIGPVTASAIRSALAETDDEPEASPSEPGDAPSLSEELERERDTLAAELTRRHRAGESHVALATEYGLMPSRVAQLTREE